MKKLAAKTGEVTGWEIYKAVLKGAAQAAWIIVGPAVKRVWHDSPSWVIYPAAAMGFVGTAYLFLRDWAQRNYQLAAYRWKVSTLSGIRRVFPVHPYGSKDPREANLVERAAAERFVNDIVAASSHVDLLLASGWRYIGCSKHKGLLYDALESKRRPGRVRVLMFDPKLVDERAKTEGIEPDRYRNGIQASFAPWLGGKKNTTSTSRCALIQTHLSGRWSSLMLRCGSWLRAVLRATHRPSFALSAEHRTGSTRV